MARARTRSEILINQTIEFMPIVLLGAAPEVALMKATLDAVWGMYIHSNLDVRSGPLQYVINGPEMHRWHHARDLDPPGKNFSTKLAIWDFLFGTAYRPAHKPSRTAFTTIRTTRATASGRTCSSTSGPSGSERARQGANSASRSRSFRRRRSRRRPGDRRRGAPS